MAKELCRVSASNGFSQTATFLRSPFETARISASERRDLGEARARDCAESSSTKSTHARIVWYAVLRWSIQARMRGTPRWVVRCSA